MKGGSLKSFEQLSNKTKMRNKKITNTIITFVLFVSLVQIAFTPTVAKAETSYVAGMQCYNANSWSASHVIYNTAQWYGLNPQIILATLQKEQSLITNPGLNQYGLDWAMGYGVPEGTTRDYSKQGFAVQVDWATWQLRWNMDNANNPVTRDKVSPYYTGNTINIDGVPTYLENGATASLYRYTPHFSNGNTNLRSFLNSWFGYTTPWNPNRIVEDSIFGNKDTMTEQQIQDFLVSKGSYLANYTVSGNVVVGADSYKCPAPTSMPVYRFWNNNGTHFYTASESEKNNVITKYPTIFKLEGVAYNVNLSRSENFTPLYRFYNKSNNTHFYTASETEKNNILQRWGNIYQLDGVAYNVSIIPGGQPVYRFWNNNGTHFYTASESEKNNIIAKWPGTFKFEGVAFYIY